MIYSEKEFSTKKKPEIGKMDTKLLVNYFKKNVMDKEFIHFLKSGEMINIKIDGNCFFHSTGLQHSEIFMKDIYKSITGEPSDGLTMKELNNTVRGYTAFNHLQRNNYPLSEENVGSWEVSRICRHNRLHSVLTSPQSIIKATPEMVKNQLFFKEGDLIFSIEDNSKVQSAVLSQDKESQSWYIKSYLVDRPKYCKFIDKINDPSLNLKGQKIIIDKDSAREYIRKAYSLKYPHYDKLSNKSCQDIKMFNDQRGGLIKLENFKRMKIKLGEEITTMRQSNEKISSKKFESLRTVSSLVSNITLAESLFIQEQELIAIQENEKTLSKEAIIDEPNI